MPNTTSWSFPNLIDVTHNRISVAEDNASVVNRTRLLFLSNPTELFNEPTFGLGLKQYLWQYNTSNVRAIIKDKMVEQLRTYEPCVDAEATQFADESMFSGSHDSYNNPNSVEMTVGLRTIYNTDLSVTLNNQDLK